MTLIKGSNDYITGGEMSDYRGVSHFFRVGKVDNRVMFGNCNPDGSTIFYFIILVIFLAAIGGLFSKNKDVRTTTLTASFFAVLGSTIAIYYFSC